MELWSTPYLLKRKKLIVLVEVVIFVVEGHCCTEDEESWFNEAATEQLDVCHNQLWIEADCGVKHYCFSCISCGSPQLLASYFPDECQICTSYNVHAM